MDQSCNRCGAAATLGAAFCTSCGAKIRPETLPEATVYCGAPGGDPEIGPGPPTAGSNNLSVRSILASLRQALRDPRQLLPLLVLPAIWLVLSLLPVYWINPWPVKVLSFLTFAQGGMYGGTLGALGGVVGKAIFAYGVSVLIVPLFSGKNPLRGARGGFKGFLAGLAVQGANAAGLLILGAGAALILFNFFTGNASPVNSMAGILGFVLALKMLLNRGGLVWGFLLSAANRLTRGRTPSQATVSRVVSGFAAGSALGVALSLLPLPYLPYLVGAALLLAGLIIVMAVKPHQEVPAV